MELPFLKNKNKPGVVVGTVSVMDPILEGIGDELLTAIEKKDIKSLRDALQALVLMIRDQDQDQDSQQ